MSPLGSSGSACFKYSWTSEFTKIQDPRLEEIQQSRREDPTPPRRLSDVYYMFLFWIAFLACCAWLVTTIKIISDKVPRGARTTSSKLSAPDLRTNEGRASCCDIQVTPSGKMWPLVRNRSPPSETIIIGHKQSQQSKAVNC